MPIMALISLITLSFLCGLIVGLIVGSDNRGR